MKKPIKICAAVLLAGIMLFSAYQLISRQAETAKQEQQFTQLAALANRTGPKKSGNAGVTGTSEAPESSTASAAEQGIDVAALQEENPDCIAWIEIPDTLISYPVMQTKDTPDYYLRTDFYHEYSDHGVPYLDFRCNLADSDNLIIYGHNMNDGSMFSALHGYMQPDFREEHTVINLYTTDGKAEYEVLAALPESGTVEQDGISIFKLTEIANKTAFDEYVEYIERHRLYDAGIIPSYGDKLISLTTCEYSQENGRLVVIGRLK